MDHKKLLDDPTQKQRFGRMSALKEKQLKLMRIYLMEVADVRIIPQEEV